MSLFTHAYNIAIGEVIGKIIICKKSQKDQHVYKKSVTGFLNYHCYLAYIINKTKIKI